GLHQDTPRVKIADVEEAKKTCIEEVTNGVDAIGARYGWFCSQQWIVVQLGKQLLKPEDDKTPLRKKKKK
ncbi:hypothetical protein pipiens_017516, partial [Culex pipiens pipiens]